MDIEKYRHQWLQEEQAAFQGWDFTHIANRCKEEPLTWDYYDLVQKYRKDNLHLLDMGTGGGEILISLSHPYQKTSVTESWEPNIQLCKRNLAPLGIRVEPVGNNGKLPDGRLPFDDNSFDLVINRHSDYDLVEVKRILVPNGLFITQQVGGKDGVELSKKIIKDYQHDFAGFYLKTELKAFNDNGFTVIYSNEALTHKYYYDIGAIVYFAKAVPWEFPGFSVESHFEQLCELQRELETNGYIQSIQHRFVVVATNQK